MIKITSWNREVDNFEDLSGVVEKAFEANELFFGKDVGEIEVAFLYTREELDSFRGQKTPDWMIGYAKNNKIYIFSQSVFGKLSDHPASEFPSALTHEIAHIFIKRLFGFSYPNWFCEGLAGVVAEQYKNGRVLKEKIIPFSKLHSYQDWVKAHGYPQAFSFTHYLFEKYGKEKIFEFSSLLGERDSLSQAEIKFKHVFGETLALCSDQWIEELT